MQPDVRFRAPSGHELVATFDGGDITSDGEVMLLRAADDRLRLLERYADCFEVHRAPGPSRQPRADTERAAANPFPILLTSFA